MATTGSVADREVPTRRTLRQHARVLVRHGPGRVQAQVRGLARSATSGRSLKPLALFTMLYLVFGHIFKLGHDLAVLRRRRC